MSDITFEEAMAAATGIARENMLKYLATMITHELGERTDAIRDEVVGTNVNSFMEVMRQNINSTDNMPDDERREVLEGLDMMRDELETLSSMSFLAGLAAAQAGLVPYGTAAPNELDMMDMSVMLSSEYSLADEYTDAVRNRLEKSGAGIAIKKLADQIAASVLAEEDSLEPHELVLLGIINYIFILDAARAQTRGLPDDGDSAIIQALIGLFVDEMRDSGLFNGNGPVNGPIA
jgi:hypothetical protein